jgi:DNA segregation ATPase FtsK/SpoIIIE, S-DNA-T family
MLYDKVNKKWLDNSGYDSKGNKFLNDKEIEKIKISNQKYANYRHSKNKEFLIFKVFRFVKKQAGKKKAYVRGLEKENSRLKMVIDSKNKWANYQNPYGLVEWRDDFLCGKHGVFAIGVTMEGQQVTFDFNKTPNILCGGAPGGGKSRLMLLVLYQALKQGSKCYLADFKGTDYVDLEDKTNIIYSHKELLEILKNFHEEYQRRRQLFRTVKARDLKEYNEKVASKDRLLREYIFIDEYAEAIEISDMNMPEGEKQRLSKGINDSCKSIARLGRAFGLNLYIATQRGDVTIIPGQFRDMLQKRICFQARKQTSNITIGSDIASTISEEDKGRAYLEKSTNCEEMQTYFISDKFLESLPNILKIVKPEEKKLKTLDEL